MDTDTLIKDLFLILPAGWGLEIFIYPDDVGKYADAAIRFQVAAGTKNFILSSPPKLWGKGPTLESALADLMQQAGRVW